jgi:hypothetical protein
VDSRDSDQSTFPVLETAHLAADNVAWTELPDFIFRHWAVNTIKVAGNQVRSDRSPHVNGFFGKINVDRDWFHGCNPLSSHERQQIPPHLLLLQPEHRIDA